MGVQRGQNRIRRTVAAKFGTRAIQYLLALALTLIAPQKGEATPSQSGAEKNLSPQKTSLKKIAFKNSASRKVFLPKAAKPQGKSLVRILLFTRLHPRRVVLQKLEKSPKKPLPEGQNVSKEWTLEAKKNDLTVDGKRIDSAWAIENFHWRLIFDDGHIAEGEGGLSVEAVAGELKFVASLKLEQYVAQTVASESLVDTPLAALEAQAVVARTYALARHGRRHHGRADLCDLAHCQVATFRMGALDESHFEKAKLAAFNTRNLVLKLPSGQFANALFHASCGGFTSRPADVFDGADTTGAARVFEGQCATPTWQAEIPSALIAQVLSESWGRPFVRDDTQDQFSPFRGVFFRRDAGGRIVQLVDQSTGKVLSGEAFVRRLGAKFGYGKIPSANFRILRVSKNYVFIEGRGKGHGVGLCQKGAAAMGRQGKSFREILTRYFPRAVLKFESLD